MVQNTDGHNGNAINEEKGPKIRVTKEQRLLVLREVLDECDRREKEMYKDKYASRDYSDGVRFENGRLQVWLQTTMGLGKEKS